LLRDTRLYSAASGGHDLVEFKAQEEDSRNFPVAISAQLALFLYSPEATFHPSPSPPKYLTVLRPAALFKNALAATPPLSTSRVTLPSIDIIQCCLIDDISYDFH
jgi:hypothetical protein